MDLPLILQQQFLVGVIRANPIPEYIGGQILPLVETASLKTMFDILANDQKLAPFVSFNAESGFAEKAVISRMVCDMADIRLKLRIEEDEYDALRMAGEPDVVLASSRSAQVRAEQAQRYIRSEIDRLRGRVLGRVEWSRWQVLTKGSVASTQTDVKFSVDFAVPAGNKVTLTGTDKWDDTTNSDPLDDLLTWKRAYILANHRVPTRVIVGANIPGYLVANSKLRDALKYSDAVTRILTDESVMAFLGSMLNMRIECYQGAYVDDAGATQYFLDADTLVMLCDTTQPDGESLGDVATGPAEANQGQPGIYGWFKQEEDPWVKFLGVGIHAFPRVYHPAWIHTAKVA